MILKKTCYRFELLHSYLIGTTTSTLFCQMFILKKDGNQLVNHFFLNYQLTQKTKGERETYTEQTDKQINEKTNLVCN